MAGRSSFAAVPRRWAFTAPGQLSAATHDSVRKTDPLSARRAAGAAAPESRAAQSGWHGFAPLWNLPQSGWAAVCRVPEQ